MPLGEYKTATFKVTNEGAISTKFQISDTAGSPFSINSTGLIEGYSTQTVEVTFKPSALGRIEHNISLRVSEKSAPEFSVALQVCCEVFLVAHFRREMLLMSLYFLSMILLPSRHACWIFSIEMWFTSRTEVQLLTNVSQQNHVHQLTIPIVQIEVPEDLTCVEFIPKSGYVQVNSVSPVQIKFRPNKHLLDTKADR